MSSIFSVKDFRSRLVISVAFRQASTFPRVVVCAHAWNLWQLVGFSKALPDGPLTAESEEEEEPPEKVAPTSKPEEDPTKGAALLLCVVRELLRRPVFK